VFERVDFQQPTVFGSSSLRDALPFSKISSQISHKISLQSRRQTSLQKHGIKKLGR
jgi:hypothetical protein